MRLQSSSIAAGGAALILSIFGATPGWAGARQPPTEPAEVVEADVVSPEETEAQVDEAETPATEDVDAVTQPADPAAAPAAGGGAPAAADAPEAAPLGSSGNGGTGGNGRPVQDPDKG